MGHAALDLPMTASDFLAWELRQPTKHEFVGGEVYAMTGALKAHVLLAMNLATALRQQLRGTPCRTFIADTMVRVDAADAFFYPDVVVSCSAADAADPRMVSEPTLVVEVLSPSTAGYDRGAKFALYRRLPSLREYALVDPETRHCDVFRKGEDGLWVLHPFDAGAGIALASVGVEVDAEALWDEVPPTTAAPASPPTA